MLATGVRVTVQVCLSLVLTTDSPPAEISAGRQAAERVQGGAYEAVANRMKEEYPNDAKRASFAKAVRGEFHQTDYHFFFDSYHIRGSPPDQ
jgi:hypothetical protein